jgi:hypothetical protein
VIEDELRATLTERVGELPTNPDRVTAVRSRIRTTRRRRTAGTALGLVLLAVAGFGATRPPGSPDSLPTAASYFRPTGQLVVPGYTEVEIFELRRQEDLLLLTGPGPFDMAVVVRCEEPGTLLVRNLAPGGPSITVDCRDRQGDHFEGVAKISAEGGDHLFARLPDLAANLRLAPGSTGAWTAAVLRANAAEPLQPWTDQKPPVLDGARSPGGGTFRVGAPNRAELGLAVSVDCVAGVKIELSVPGGVVGTADCDPTREPTNGVDGMRNGRVMVTITTAAAARLGIRPGRPVSVTARSVGRPTDQWRIAFAG